VAESLGVERHIVTRLDLGSVGGSALTDDLPVPKDRSDEEIGGGIPVTYVPARNTVFLSIALAGRRRSRLTTSSSASTPSTTAATRTADPSTSRPSQRMADLATKTGVEGRPITFHAPLLHLRKEEIVRRGLELGVNFRLTRSCYDPTTSGEACGACDSCRLRLRAFEACGVPDPAPYRP
jgi:7-cyano-7-deazaguanine synthase